MSLEIVIDDITETEWRDCASNFADYSIYQTWAYQQQRAESEKLQLSRFIIKEGPQAVSMGQVRIMNIGPLLKIGYVQWGPLLRGKNDEMLCSAEALSALRKAYLGSRVNILRLVPNIVDGESGRKISEMLQSAGFTRATHIKPYQTILLPLDTDEDELRKNLDQRWRNKLNKAQKAGLEVKYDSNEDHFGVFETLYQQMAERKNFETLDVKIFRQCQQYLGTSEKMNLIAAYYQGQPVTVNINSCLGDTSIVLFAAGNECGHRYGANNLTWWHSFMAARQAGMKKCDLGGVDPVNNPGVYDFKNKVGGQETLHIGTFEAYSGGFVRSAWQLVQKLHDAVKKRK